MKFQLAIIGFLLWATAVEAGAGADLFTRNKSDSAVKPLVFPLSMLVVENKPLKGHYYFFEGQNEKFNQELKGDPGSPDNEFNRVMSDPAMIKKTLVAADRARINPSDQREDLRGPVTKEALGKLAQKYSRDMVLVFRREIRVEADTPLADAVFLEPQNLIKPGKSEPLTLRIRDRGLVYLAKQKKILTVPARENSTNSLSNGGDQTAPDQMTGNLIQLSKKGLTDLAASARKTIRDKEFFVRRPNY